MSEPMLFLRSLAFNVGWYAVSFVMALVGAPIILLTPQRWVLAYAQAWCRVVIWLARVCCGITHEVRGREHLPAGPVLIASKHQSSWETLAFNFLFPGAAIVLKRELFWIPLVGWAMWRVGNVGVDRAAGTNALRRLLKDSRAALDAGRPLLIFPEGTRTAPGAEAPYQPGVAALYSQLKVPVAPVALNSGRFWGRRKFVKRPGRIVVEILPPIPPGLPRARFMDELRQRIETASAALPHS
jgi:1-acyl-sn-glycerol-3-phosphate acyltransferase